MKKSLISILCSAILLTACNDDPYSLVINSIEDLETHKVVLQSMSEADKDIFSRYMVRKEFSAKFGGSALPNNITVKEAIQNQLVFEQEVKTKEEQKRQKEEQEKIEKERVISEFNKRFELSIAGSHIAKDVLNKDILVISLALKNNSDKSIQAIQPDIKFILGEEEQTISSWKPKKFREEIKPSEMGTFDFGLDLEEMFAMKAEKNISNVKALFRKAEILFTDGTSEKLE